MSTPIKALLVAGAILSFVYGLPALFELQGGSREVGHDIVMATLFLAMTFCVADVLNLLYPEYDMHVT